MYMSEKQRAFLRMQFAAGNLSLWDEIQIYIITFVLTWIQANSDEINTFLNQYVSQGEAAVIAAATKLNAELGALLQVAFTALGPNLPKLEGDAAAWLEAVMTAYLKKIKAG